MNRACPSVRPSVCLASRETTSHIRNKDEQHRKNERVQFGRGRMHRLPYPAGAVLLEDKERAGRSEVSAAEGSARQREVLRQPVLRTGVLRMYIRQQGTVLRRGTAPAGQWPPCARRPVRRNNCQPVVCATGVRGYIIPCTQSQSAARHRHRHRHSPALACAYRRPVDPPILPPVPRQKREALARVRPAGCVVSPGRRPPLLGRSAASSEAAQRSASASGRRPANGRAPPRALARDWTAVAARGEGVASSVAV